MTQSASQGLIVLPSSRSQRPLKEPHARCFLHTYVTESVDDDGGIRLADEVVATSRDRLSAAASRANRPFNALTRVR